MIFARMLLATIVALLSGSALAIHTIANGSQITVTTIITTSENISAFQCWTFSAPFLLGPAPFLALNLGDFDNLTYRVFPPHSSTGVHNAPRHQLILVQSGIVMITLPDGSDDPVYAQPGPSGLILALDVEGQGHTTSQPSDEEGLVLELPFRNGVIPPHKVINETGACRGQESFL
ncbi:hypothetical protein NA57DRAFT_59039 [Rhizodiscina lignyota]|uniref:Cupin type-1 domain-containing protein n=1 Tax=Rhizodiscina lignyota TaxID=1504668 RepID=A0A9P4IA84_9PEZI|nr:hypothetical protein NA57DRAFT_59039 [Rhizodiscina lignyota]